MIFLNSAETNSIQDAVNYYDCAAEKTLFDKVENIKGQDVVVLSKDEIKKLLTYIYEMDCCVHNGAIQPPTLPFLSVLEDFVK